MRRRVVAVLLAGSLVAGCAWRGARSRTSGESARTAAAQTGVATGSGSPADAPAPGRSADGSIGNYLDRQKADLEEVVARDDRVERDGETVRVILASDALFDAGRSRLRPGARAELDELARVLNEHPRTRLDVIGHTDDRGRRHVNDVLSERRAAAVRDALVRGGVEPGRLTARGAGESRPITTNDTPEGRATNRRIEILSRPDDSLTAEARQGARASSPPPPEVERR